MHFGWRCKSEVQYIFIATRCETSGKDAVLRKANSYFCDQENKSEGWLFELYMLMLIKDEIKLIYVSTNIYVKLLRSQLVTYITHQKKKACNIYVPRKVRDKLFNLTTAYSVPYVHWTSTSIASTYRVWVLVVKCT